MRNIIDGLASVAMIAASGAIIWATLANPSTRIPSPRPSAAPVSTDVPGTPVSIAGAQLKGSSQAPVVLIAFSDFQCPYCRNFAREVLPDIVRKHVENGKVLLAFRHFPLERTHPLALPAAVASECAGKQRQFWEAHDWLFGLNGDPPSEVAQLKALPTTLGLDAPSFMACMNTPDVAAQVRRDMQAAKSLEVSGTPAFFIGLRRSDGTVQLLKRINGAQPVSAFDASIKEALAKVGV